MLHRFLVSCSVLALFAGLSASLAKADSVDPNPTVTTTTIADDFSFVLGPDTYTWTIASPVAAAPMGPEAFDVSVPYTFDGTQTSGTFEFYPANNTGGFFLCDGAGAPACSTGQGLVTNGDALFSGDTSSPTFTPGTYTLTEEVPNFGPTGTLTISAVSGPGGTATPEPSTLLLTGIGVLGLFWVARKRRFSLSA